jgi:CheY-like chemotaxis protein
MHRQMSHLTRIVDDLLDVNRITRGKIELRRETIDLLPALRQAVEMTTPLASGEGQQIELHLPAEPLYVNADAARLTQVFGNLLSNAYRYSPAGTRISARAAREYGQAVVTIADHGIGIPADKLDAIFELFTQIDRSTEQSIGGLGIGLHLVKTLIDMHGGTVVAHSEGRGKGSEFSVRLPLVPAPAIKPQPAAVPPQPKRQGNRILVVDDNVDAAKTLAMLLKLGGNETQTAHDGEQAVEKAAAFSPQVVLLDIGLPKLNGYDACRAIRRQPGHNGMVIIALTGWGQEEDRQKSAEAGFDAHLVKPVDHAELLKLLQRICPSNDRPPALAASARDSNES